MAQRYTLRPPRLLAVTDPETRGPDAGSGWTLWCAALARAGVDGLQLREPALSDRARLERALAARAAFPRPGALLVNARLDLALAAEADGVHLPAAGLPLAPLRAVKGPRPMIFGRSTHTVEEVAAARAEGFDYAIFGPVFPTPSKAGRLAPRGISSLREAALQGLPVIAIGGIDGDNAAEAAAAGAWGVAAIRLFADPERDSETIRNLRALWPDPELMTRILGIGLDLVDVDRFAQALARHGEPFVERICRDGEAKPLAGRPRVAHLAGLFAAKEAAMKALGTGWAAGIGFRQIEVERAAGGAPSLRLHGAAAARAATMGVTSSHLSITHDGRSAAAVVIFEGEPA